MTFAMDLVIQINKRTPFKTVTCNYTASGVEAVLVDGRDGQEYHIDIKPNGVTLSPEAIDDMMNPESNEAKGA